MNSVSIVGRLVAAPELKKTPQGVPFCRVTLAVDRPISREKREGGAVGEDFIDCTVWRQAAENLARYKGQGDTIAVTGRLRTRISELQAQDLDKRPLTYSDGTPILTSVKFTDLEVENVTYINQARYAPNSRQGAVRPSQGRQGPSPQQVRAGTQGGRTDDFSGDPFALADEGVPADEFEQMMADISDEQLAAA